MFHKLLQSMVSH